MVVFICVALDEGVQGTDSMTECMRNRKRALVDRDPDIEDSCPGLGIAVQVLEPLRRVHQGGDSCLWRPDPTGALCGQT